MSVVAELRLGQKAPGTWPRITCKFANKKITCQDRPAEDFVTRTWSEELASDVQANVFVMAVLSDASEGEVHVNGTMLLREGMHTAVAGDMWIRLPGDEAYQPAATCITHQPEPGIGSLYQQFVLRDAAKAAATGDEKGAKQHRWRHPGITSAPCIDVKLVPDIKAAFDMA